MASYKSPIDRLNDPGTSETIKIVWGMMSESFQSTYRMSKEDADQCVSDYVELGLQVVPKLMKRNGRDFEYLKNNDVLLPSDTEPYMSIMTNENVICTYASMWNMINTRKGEFPEEDEILSGKLSQLNDPDSFIENYFPESEL
ncbi:MAG: hypothetical protein JW789_00425 [Candidatus Aenigmarchaeota archaeon]|nr:hypothetical protein [Candidatus Aenigmarchaeota archaeon]